MAFRISNEECICCGACETVCPESCISEIGDTEKRIIDESECISCGACAEICPVACIFNVDM